MRAVVSHSTVVGRIALTAACRCLLEIDFSVPVASDSSIASSMAVSTMLPRSAPENPGVLLSVC